MIIVSQDKTLFINFDNVSAIAIDDNDTNRKIYTRCNNDDNVLLGKYATKERTKEVLKEIYQAVENWENLKAGQPTGECRFRYEMPEE